MSKRTWTATAAALLMLALLGAYLAIACWLWPSRTRPGSAVHVAVLAVVSNAAALSAAFRRARNKPESVGVPWSTYWFSTQDRKQEVMDRIATGAMAVAAFANFTSLVVWHLVVQSTVVNPIVKLPFTVAALLILAAAATLAVFLILLFKPPAQWEPGPTERPLYNWAFGFQLQPADVMSKPGWIATAIAMASLVLLVAYLVSAYIIWERTLGVHGPLMIWGVAVFHNGIALGIAFTGLRDRLPDFRVPWNRYWSSTPKRKKEAARRIVTGAMAVASFVNLAMLLVWHATLCSGGRIRVAQTSPLVAVCMILAGFAAVAVFLILLFKPLSAPRRSGEASQ